MGWITSHELSHGKNVTKQYFPGWHMTDELKSQKNPLQL